MSSQDQTTRDQTTVVDESIATRDLLETAVAAGVCSKFLELVRLAGLTGRLKGPELQTVFVPVDGAFGDVRIQERDEAEAFVNRHTVRGRLTVADFKLSSSLKDLNDRKVPVQVGRPDALYGGGRIIRADIPCTNGVLHLTEGVAREI